MKIIQNHRRRIPMTHKLKCQNTAFASLWDGKKNCEFRKDDRGFREGDIIELHEYLQGGRFKIPKKYCVRSLKEFFTLTRLK